MAISKGESWVFIGLGSNLADPQQQVRHALDALNEIPGTSLIAASHLYRSAPMGPQDQPDYVNAVARLETDLDPDELLKQLQSIELSHGRDRVNSIHWGPRTLDLDILAWGERLITDTHLTVPHPGVAEREFVVYPWLELAPDFIVPGLGAVASLADGLPRRGLEIVDGSVSGAG